MLAKNKEKVNFFCKVFIVLIVVKILFAVNNDTLFLRLMCPCIVNIFQNISNKMHHYTVYLNLETALHVSGATSTHHQERIQMYLQHLVFVTQLLLFATTAAGSSNGVTNTRCSR
jgi:hypothetical protein